MRLYQGTDCRMSLAGTAKLIWDFSAVREQTELRNESRRDG